MFLGHFSGWSYTDLMEMEMQEMGHWYNVAIELHKQLNHSK